MPKPRWQPDWKMWTEASQKEIFLGHAGEIDVYFEYRGENGEPDRYIYVVGPDHRKTAVNPDGGYNFDGYRIVGQSLEMEGREKDVHIELHEMCKLMKLIVKRGYIKLENEDAETVDARRAD